MAQCRKIFQIGFSKCGTTTLHYFFQNNGLNSVHWLDGKIARKMEENIKAGQPILREMDSYDAYTDMVCPVKQGRPIEGYKFYRELYEEYPDSYYLLNIRNVDNWIKSRWGHIKEKGYNPKTFNATKEELEERWRKDWDLHTNNVQQFFKDKKDTHFLVFDIEKDGPEKLVEFLKEFNLDAAKYELKNKTPSWLVRQKIRIKKTIIYKLLSKIKSKLRSLKLQRAFK